MRPKSIMITTLDAITKILKKLINIGFMTII